MYRVAGYIIDCSDGQETVILDQVVTQYDCLLSWMPSIYGLRAPLAILKFIAIGMAFYIIWMQFSSEKQVGLNNLTTTFHFSILLWLSCERGTNFDEQGVAKNQMLHKPSNVYIWKGRSIDNLRE